MWFCWLHISHWDLNKGYHRYSWVWLHTLICTSKLYIKRDYFNFPIVNFPFICSNIQAAPPYGVYISQMIWYSIACGSYRDFLDRRLLLTRKLLYQWFLMVRLKSSLRQFTVATITWLTVTEYMCYKWPRICSICRNHNQVSLLIYDLSSGL